MRSSGRPARLVRAGLVVAALAGATVVAPATATAAPQPSDATVHRSAWLGTDSRRPHEGVTTGDARVGS